MPRQYPRVSEETIVKWGEMLDEGMAYKHIAQMFKVSPRTVRKHHPGRGWTHSQACSYGRLVEQFRTIAE